MTAFVADLTAVSPESPFDSEAELLHILRDRNVRVPDEDEDPPVRTWGVEFVPAELDRVLVDALLEWAKRSAS